MRKHDVRKWLHAALDLLPVILIPVFMVYSHRHDVTENVEINYKYQSNEVNSVDDLVEGNIYALDSLSIDIGSLGNEGDTLDIGLLKFTYEEGSLTNTTLDEIYLDNYLNYENNNIGLYIEPGMFSLLFSNSNAYTNVYFDDTDYILLSDIVFQYHSYNNRGYSLIQNCTYTDYNVIESVDTINTNVMDSFMNKFNTTIDKYFNMGNVFNLNGVYQWFNTNIFSGNAPTIIYSIWNIALYELVMDLLFLLYGLFMWFIDMVERMMDKPFKSIK